MSIPHPEGVEVDRSTSTNPFPNQQTPMSPVNPPTPVVPEPSRRVIRRRLATRKQASQSQMVMSGVDVKTAHVAAGYEGRGDTRALSSPNVIAANTAILEKAGVTPDLVAEKLLENLNANKTVFVGSYDEKGNFNGKRPVVEADNHTRQKAVEFSGLLLGMTPQAAKVQIDINNRAAPVIQNNTVIFADLDLSNKTQAEKMAMFKERMNQVANKRVGPLVDSVVKTDDKITVNRTLPIHSGNRVDRKLRTGEKVEKNVVTGEFEAVLDLGEQVVLNAPDPLLRRPDLPDLSGKAIKFTPWDEVAVDAEYIRMGNRPVLLTDIQGERVTMDSGTVLYIRLGGRRVSHKIYRRLENGHEEVL